MITLIIVEIRRARSTAHSIPWPRRYVRRGEVVRVSSRYVEIRRARSTAHGMRKRVLISNDYTNNCLITTDCSRKFLRLRRPPVSQSVGMGSGILGSRTPLVQPGKFDSDLSCTTDDLANFRGPHSRTDATCLQHVSSAAILEHMPRRADAPNCTCVALQCM